MYFDITMATTFTSRLRMRLPHWLIDLLGFYDLLIFAVVLVQEPTSDSTVTIVPHELATEWLGRLLPVKEVVGSNPG